MKVKINNKYYRFFDEISINYKLDSVASIFSFNARFNPDNEGHRAVFKPLQFQKVEIYTNDDVLRFTGVVVNTSLGSQPSSELQSISGYSLPGILEDCTIPYTSYPLEKNNVSLNDIANIFLSSFGISYVVDSTAEKDMDLQYNKTSAGVTENFKSFISKLASQRNIILSHTSNGALKFFKPNFNAKPKFFFDKNNTLSMSLKVNGQSMHSDISVIRQVSVNNTNIVPVDTVKNNLIPNFRPTVKVLSSGIESDTKKAANNILASELRNIGVSIYLPEVLDIECGDIVEVQNDEIYLFTAVKFVVSEIVLSENVNSESMTLSLVIPETYTGESPGFIFG